MTGSLAFSRVPCERSCLPLPACGAAFRANGTPMAVLLDADSRIASAVVAGADTVVELAGRKAGRR